jgi:hypothetical protein
MEAQAIAASPLWKYTEADLWVTAGQTWFMANLRHIAVRQPPTWFFKVVSDADLMTAWLSSAVLKGKDILDPDVRRVSLTYVTLVDLIIPPQLLVIRLGVKKARNVATPEVLLESLREREHNGLPTWVWDTPRERLAEGHICWSNEVTEYLGTWKHISTRLENDPSSASKAPSDDTEDETTSEVEALKGATDFIDLTPGKTAAPKPSLSGGSSRKTYHGGGDK